MTFQESKKRERELKKHQDQRAREEMISRRHGTVSPPSTSGSNEELRESYEIKPEVIVKKDATSSSPSTVVAIGEKQPINSPFMYTRKGILNTPQSD
jgi:hypothetical protein